NTFLHFLSFDQIDWPSIARCKEVTLVVAPVILAELDRKKYEATGKIRERSRAAINRLSRFIDNHVAEPLRAGVTLQLLDREPGLDYSTHGLDKDVPDDRLLASVIYFREQDGFPSASIVTADVGLQLKSRSRGVQVVILPDDLRLPEGPDPNEKQIQQLT